MLFLVTNAAILEESSEDYLLVNCAVAVLKQIFTGKNTIVFSLQVERAVEVNNFYNPLTLTPASVDIAHYEHCSINETNLPTLEIINNPYENWKLFFSRSDGLDPHTHFFQGTEDLLLKHIHESQEWPLYISPQFGINRVTNENLIFKSFVFIVECSNVSWCEEQIEKQIAFLYVEHIVNGAAPVVVILTGDLKDRTTIIKVFEKFSANSLKDVSVIAKSDSQGAINVYTWFPYELPTGKCGFVEDIVLLDTWVNDINGGHFIKDVALHLDKAPAKIKNCYFEYVVVSSVYFYFFLAFGRSAEQTIVHYLGSNLTAILSSLIFSNDMNLSQNQTFSIHVFDIFDNWDQYLMGPRPSTFFQLRYTFFVPRAPPYPRWNSMSRVFHWTTWITGTFCFVITAVISQAISNLKRTGQSRNISYFFVELWAALLGVGVQEVPLPIVQRILFISWAVFSFCINTVFQTFVTSYLVDPGLQYQIQTIEDIIEKNFTIASDNIQTAKYWFFMERGNRLLLLPYPAHPISLLFYHENSVAFSSDELFTYYIRELCGNEEVPNFFKFKEDILSLSVGLVTASDQLLQHQINYFTRLLEEAGIINKIYSNITCPTGIRRWEISETEMIDNFSAISLTHLQSPLIFMCIGVLVSLFALVGEIGFRRYERDRSK